jgi:pimeloyl-ACP methyl ester carboxylesterase
MGGIIAMAYAGEYPERLLRLIINGIGPDMEEGTQRITQTVGSRPDEFTTLDEAMAYRRQAMPVMASRGAEDELALGAPPRPALWPVLQRLPCPTLVVWGTESDVLSEAQARRMVEVLPRGELVAVPGVGHAPTLVEPVALAALERFLSGPG